MRNASRGGRSALDHRMKVAAVQELAQLVRIRNDVNDPAAITENATAIRALFERRGFATRLLETSKARPAVFAELPLPEPGRRAPRILVYSHYDGVPPGDGWDGDPYEPVLREAPREDGRPGSIVAGWDAPHDPEWRLYGRSAADSKHAIVALPAAVDLARERRGSVGVHLKVLLDGEEERESPGLPAVLERHADLLQADVVLSASGEMHPSGRPTVIAGFRGILLLELTVVTAAHAAHSGHFGGIVPNAAIELARLLSTLKGEDGHVRVAGFYDDVRPLDHADRLALERTPAIDDELRARFAFHRPEIVSHRWHELLPRPTLNVRGMVAGGVGVEGVNIVPHRARAELDLRLVTDMDPDATQALVASHLRAAGATVLDREPTRQELLEHPRIAVLRRLAAFPATRTSLTHPRAACLIEAVRTVADGPIVVEPTGGRKPAPVPVSACHRRGPGRADREL